MAATSAATRAGFVPVMTALAAVSTVGENSLEGDGDRRFNPQTISVIYMAIGMALHCTCCELETGQTNRCIGVYERGSLYQTFLLSISRRLRILSKLVSCSVYKQTVWLPE
jgi:hypothetical protein